MMNINNFRGDVTDVSAKTNPLLARLFDPHRDKKGRPFVSSDFVYENVFFVCFWDTLMLYIHVFGNETE